MLYKNIKITVRKFSGLLYRASYTTKSGLVITTDPMPKHEAIASAKEMIDFDIQQSQPKLPPMGVVGSGIGAYLKRKKKS